MNSRVNLKMIPITLILALLIPSVGISGSISSSSFTKNEAIQSDQDSEFAMIVSDENLPNELSRLRNHLAKLQIEFASFEYSGFYYRDVEKIKAKLMTSEYFVNLNHDKKRAMDVARMIDKKLQAQQGGCDYTFWVLDFIYSKNLKQTLPQIDQIISNLNEDPRVAYGYLADLPLSARIDTYKKILDQQVYVDLQLDRIPAPFAVLVELYRLAI